MNEFTKAFINSCFSKESPRLITACFRDGRCADYPESTLPLLRTDKDVEYIIDAETGEIL